MKFAPPLINGGTVAGTAKFKGALSNCTGAHTPAGITGGKVSGSFSLSTNDCGAYNVSPNVNANFGPANVDVKWKGSPRVLQTSGVATAGAPSALSWTEFDIPGFSVLGLTGSFATDLNPYVHAAFGGGGLFLAFAIGCLPKTAGEPGTGGVKKVVFSTAAGSYLSISP